MISISQGMNEHDTDLQRMLMIIWLELRLTPRSLTMFFYSPCSAKRKIYILLAERNKTAKVTKVVVTIPSLTYGFLLAGANLV